MNQQELHIKETLPALSFNYDQLKEWAQGLTARYTDMVVTEDAVADVKRDMAELNKNKAKLETARKETVRRLSEPLRTFETQIKEVCGIFDDAYSRLGNQVKAFEDTQREEKRNKVLELIGQCFADAFGAYGDWSDFEIPVQDKWLNKTTSLKTVREDVAAIIQRHIEEEQRKVALEQARRERAAAIESHVKMLNAQREMTVSVSRFIAQIDLAVPIETVLSKITSFFANEAKNKAAMQRTAAPFSQPAAHPGDGFADYGDACRAEQQQSKAAPQPETRAMSIVIEYDVRNEAQIKACLENLKPLCVKFGARYR